MSPSNRLILPFCFVLLFFNLNCDLSQMDGSATADSLISWLCHAWHARHGDNTSPSCTVALQKADGRDVLKMVFAHTDALPFPSRGATHSHVHTFDMSDGVILTQQLPVARFPLVAWPFKQGERRMARGQRSIMRRSHSVSVSLSYFVCSLIFFPPPFFNFLSPLCQPAASGVAAKASAVVTLGNLAEGFTEARGKKIHANARALNTQLCPYRDSRKFFLLHFIVTMVRFLVCGIIWICRQDKESKPEPVSGHTLQPDLRLHDT